MQARLLLLLVSFTVVLAGCASPDSPDGSDDGNGGVPANATPAEAQALLEQASRNVPDKMGTQMVLAQGSRTLLAMNGTFDNATGMGYVEIRGDADALRAASGAGGEGDDDSSEAMIQMMADGFALYVTKEGSLYLMNGTAFTFPPANESGDSQGFVPSPDESPFGAFLAPQDIFGNLTEEGATVKSVTPTTHRGKGALRVTMSLPLENATAEPVVTLFTNPPRVARIEGVNPFDAQSPGDPFAGATVAIDFFYDNEVTMRVPESATRALALAYDSDRELFSFGEPKPETWTFLHDSGIPLGEVEIHVKDASGGDASDVTSAGSLPTLWTMTLSDLTKTEGGVTVTFTDVDGDGKVSEGDTLRIEGDGEETPTVLLRDIKTGTYVVPGPALLLVLAGLGAAALVLRRK